MHRNLTTSRSRRPRTAVSTVSQIAVKPDALARSIRSLTSPRSFQVYTWNHFSPSLTAATSSIERVPMVESDHGSPAWAAARATASSPWE